ncbi:MAG: DUF2892 domain-containing protein [Bacteroidia bacterium]|nr:DUF2892 domain-containing protein [Bacteroidia bacterium]
MICNVGKTDSWLRIILGLLAGILGIVFTTWWGLVGVILFFTGIFRWCPLYQPLKISTVKDENQD